MTATKKQIANYTNRMTDAPSDPAIPEALAQYKTQRGTTLAALSEQAPVLLIFLRHFG
jgi:hypothetical protein